MSEPQVHPRLRELAEEAAAEAQEQTATPEEETPAVTEAEAPAEPSAQAEARPESDNFYRLEKARLYEEIARLDREDPVFRENVRTFGGRKTKREMESEVTVLKAELEALKLQQRQQAFKAMDPEDIEQRFSTDPEFAQQYTATLHGKPVDVDAQREVVAWTNRFETLVDEFVEGGAVPKQWGDQTMAWLREGKFDRDPQGRPLDPFGSYEAVRRYLSTASNVYRSQRAAPPANPAQAPTRAPVAAAPQQQASVAPEATKAAPQPNRKLADAAPDMSNGSHGGGARRGMALEDYKRMNPREKMAYAADGLESAISSGLVYRE